MGRKVRVEDGFDWVALNNLPKGCYKQILGEGDDVANGARGDGASFEISESTTGDHDVEWQHTQLAYVLGGICHAFDHVEGDVISFGVYAPATAGVSNTGAGDYDKSIVGAGKYRFRPVGEGEGDWDLNISETLNGNVGFTKAVPYPNPYGTGYFNFNPATGALTAAPAGNGGYDVYDHAKELSTFVFRIPVVAVLDLRDDGVVSTPVLPHYRWRVRYNRASASAFRCCWRITLGFYDTRTGLWGDA